MSSVENVINLSGTIFCGDVFQLGTGKNYSINELADMFGTGKTHLPKRPGEANIQDKYKKTALYLSKATQTQKNRTRNVQKETKLEHHESRLKGIFAQICMDIEE